MQIDQGFRDAADRAATRWLERSFGAETDAEFFACLALRSAYGRMAAADGTTRQHVRSAGEELTIAIQQYREASETYDFAPIEDVVATFEVSHA